MNSKNLITEINIMRSMMGLKEKSILITENFIVGLAKAFSKTAARHADDVTKILDDFISTAAGGGSLAAQRTMATRLKGLLDNLDSAVKIGDDAAIKSTIKSILDDADFGATAATKIADDMFADTADDAITAVLNKRANTFKGRGLTDEAIKAQIKSDIDALLGEFPDTLKNAAKSKADNAINWGGKGTRVVTSSSKADEVFSMLAGNPTWSKVQNEFPTLFSKLRTRVQDLAEAGAKNSDEIYSLIIKQAENGMKPGMLKWWKGFKASNPTLVKWSSRSLGVIVLLEILEEAAGKVGLLKKFGASVCELAGGEDNSFLWCDDWIEAVRAAEEDEKNQDNKNQDNKNKEENTTTGKCDKTEEDFKTWAKSNVGTDNVTFNSTSCMGSVKDKDGNVIASFTWNGTAWV